MPCINKSIIAFWVAPFLIVGWINFFVLGEIDLEGDWSVYKYSTPLLNVLVLKFDLKGMDIDSVRWRHLAAILVYLHIAIGKGDFNLNIAWLDRDNFVEHENV
ncbi:MAG: hypothetical protein BWY95_01499 [Bacteroidetes bacterium ADurb.BinA104]|nr:MAG: hypothetical protein BWY95_01499 [Bacteroidetes bacterium ADurb.BinA104]